MQAGDVNFDPQLTLQLGSLDGTFLPGDAFATIEADVVFGVVMTSSISSSDLTPHPSSAYWLFGGGEMGDRIRAFDWASTPIGASDSWSPALRTTLGIMLANRFPLLLWWGPQYISIYNDAYRPVLGAKHPWALGRPVSECWSEIWHVLQPLIDTPFNGGPPPGTKTFSWNSIATASSRRRTLRSPTAQYRTRPRRRHRRRAGDRARNHGEGGRRAADHVLRDLGSARRRGQDRRGRLRYRGRDPGQSTRKDVPFALLYLIDATVAQARLAGAAGVSAGGSFSPSR